MIKSELLDILQTGLQKEPVNYENVKNILKIITGINEESEISKLTQLIILITKNLLSEIERLTTEKEKNLEKSIIKPNKLALIFRRYRYLLTDFTVKFEKDEAKIYYKNDSSKETLYKAYDYLRLELSKYIGYKEFDNSTISRAIMQAKNYLEYEKECIADDILASTIIEKAHILLKSRKNRKKISIFELKKSIPTLNLTNSEIEKILLDAGWSWKKYGKCKTKYFTYKKD